LTHAIADRRIGSKMKCIIWDFDGTLVERDGMWSGALVEVASREGIHTTREAIRPFLQSGFPWHTPEFVRARDEPADQWWERLEAVFCRAFAVGVGLPRHQALKLACQVRGVYTDARRWRVFPDVELCLTTLSSSGWQHVILSNHVPELERLVVALGLGKHFKAIFSSATTGVEKPNAQAFQLVREMLGDGVQFRMVGDSWQADICGAARSGIEGCLVRTSHPEAKLFCADLATLPTLIVDDKKSNVS
jgi:putative hydrolase of the HAD superfamily